jgi:transposase
VARTEGGYDVSHHDAFVGVLCDRLKELDVARLIMEAMSDYLKAPLYLLEAAGLETWLVNARTSSIGRGTPSGGRRRSG